MPDTMTTVAALFRYPVKGLRGVEVHDADLVEGHGIPGDRCFAIARSGSDGRQLEGDWASSRTFVINVDCEGLLELDLTVSDDGSRIVIANPDGKTAELVPGQTGGLDRANEVLMEHLSGSAGNNLNGPALVERNGGKGYWDFQATQISIINHASVEAVGRVAGEELDPRRFRGNLYVSGLPAWEENAWLGQRLRIGEAELIVARGAERCPATSVNPQTGVRDMQLPTLMQQKFGHIFCGVYAQVVKGGRIAANDRVEILGPSGRDPLEGLPDNAPPYARWPRFAQVSKRTDGAEITIHLSADGAWPLAPASPGQKIRFHLGEPGWCSARLTGIEDGEYRLALTPGNDPDKAMSVLIDRAQEGARLLVSGPFGRPAPGDERADVATEKSVQGIF